MTHAKASSNLGACRTRLRDTTIVLREVLGLYDFDVDAGRPLKKLEQSITSTNFG